APAAAGLRRAAAAHRHAGRTSPAPGRRARVAKPGRRRPPACAAGLVPRGRSQRHPCAAGFLRTPEGLLAAGHSGLGMRVRATACLVAILLAPPLAAQDTGMGVTSTGVPSMGVPSTGVPSMARHYMARMDEDGDARISLAEYQDWMGYAFARMDGDG